LESEGRTVPDEADQPCTGDGEVDGPAPAELLGGEFPQARRRGDPQSRRFDATTSGSRRWSPDGSGAAVRWDGNGASTWNLHARRLADQAVSALASDGEYRVKKAEVVALVGDHCGGRKSCPVDAHLSFEVRRHLPGSDPADGQIVGPYSERAEGCLGAVCCR
jgi:hypothetical protein